MFVSIAGWQGLLCCPQGPGCHCQCDRDRPHLCTSGLVSVRCSLCNRHVTSYNCETVKHCFMGTSNTIIVMLVILEKS